MVQIIAKDQQDAVRRGAHEMAGILSTLLEVHPTPAPETSFYLALNSDIARWELYRDLLLEQGLIKVSAHAVTLTDAGRERAQLIDQTIKKITEQATSGATGSDTVSTQETTTPVAAVVTGSESPSSVSKEETTMSTKEKPAKKSKKEAAAEAPAKKVKKAKKTAELVTNYKRSELLAMLKQLGFDTCDGWAAARILAKLKTLGELAEVDPGDHKELFTQITVAVDAGADLTIEDDVPDAPKAKKDKSEKGDKPAKKPKGEKKAKAAVAKDKFGTKEGTQCAKINAVIGKKAKTAKEIHEESGVTLSLVKAHLATLLRKGIIGKSDAGYFDIKFKDDQPAEKPAKKDKEEKPAKKAKKDEVVEEEEEEDDDSDEEEEDDDSDDSDDDDDDEDDDSDE